MVSSDGERNENEREKRGENEKWGIKKLIAVRTILKKRFCLGNLGVPVRVLEDISERCNYQCMHVLDVPKMRLNKAFDFAIVQKSSSSSCRLLRHIL